MASKSLGTLTLDLVAQVGGFVKGMDQAERSSKKWRKQVEAETKKAAIALASIGTIGVAAMAKYIANTKTTESAQAQLKAALESTAGAAGFTAAELNKMSSALEKSSTFSADDIANAQTALLTYTGIVGNEFKRAQQAAIDMATRTGQSVARAAEQIGRALDVPSSGMTSLSKQGFKFSEEQKELVKQLESVGRTAEAQGIVLDALEESYKGSAQAARDTFSGALTALQNTIGGLMTGDDASLSGMKDAVNALTDALSDPKIKQSIDSIFSTLASVATVAVKALGYVKEAAIAVAAVMVGRYTPAIGATVVSMALATVESVRYQATLARMAGTSVTAAAGLTTLSVAARAAGAAMAFLGGPVGMAIAAVSAIAMYALSTKDASEATDKLSEKVAQLGDNYERMNAAQKAAASQTLNDFLIEQEKSATKLGSRIETLEKNLREFSRNPKAEEWRRELVELRGRYADIQDDIDITKSKLEQLASAGKAAVNSFADVPSAAFEKMKKELELQLALVGSKSDAERLATKIRLEGIEGLKAGEGDLLVALQAQIDKRREQISAEESAASAAKARAERERQDAASRAASIESEISAIERAAIQWGMAADQVKLYSLAESGASAHQLDRARNALKAVELLEQQKKQAEDYKGLVADLRTDEEKRTEELRKQLAIIEAQAGESGEEKKELAGRAIDQAFDQDAPDYKGMSFEVGGFSAEIEGIGQAQSALEDWYSTQTAMLESLHEQKLVSQEEYNAKAEELQQTHADKMAAIDNARYTVAAAAAEQAFGSIAQIIAKSGRENSNAYRAVFAMEKAFAVGRSIMAINTAIAQASTSAPFPANIAAMGAVIAATAGLVANIQAVGMAHDGIDSVPKTGTWLLEKGERVTTAQTSAKLDGVLSDIQRGGTSNQSAPEMNIKNINVLDPSIVGDYLNTADGERVIMNVVQRNRSSF